MPQKEAVLTDKAPAPLPFFSQAIKCQGMVYCSGSVGVDPKTNSLVEGGIGLRTRQCLTNLSAVLEAAGSSIDNCVKVNIFLTNMENFAAVNSVYGEFITKDPKPVRTCVAVFQLPLGTDVEIECIAHQNPSPASKLGEGEIVKKEEDGKEEKETTDINNQLLKNW